jgi:hypothetical protein
MSKTRALQLAELGVPGAAIGAASGAVVGLLAAAVGQPTGWAAVGALTLGVPLALLGAGYGAIAATGWFRPGVFAPVAIYWMLGFPLSRLVHETVTPVLLGGSPTPPSDVLTFLLFQALVSMGFAIGFIWLHERIAPHWLMRIQDHNPAAQRMFAVYVKQASAMWEARESKRARRGTGRDRPRAAASSSGAARARSRRSS